MMTKQDQFPELDTFDWTERERCQESDRHGVCEIEAAYQNDVEGDFVHFYQRRPGDMLEVCFELQEWGYAFEDGKPRTSWYEDEEPPLCPGVGEFDAACKAFLAANDLCIFKEDS